MQESKGLYVHFLSGDHEDCRLAKQLIFLSISHHQASLVSVEKDVDLYDEYDYFNDLRTFYSEINYLAQS